VQEYHSVSKLSSGLHAHRPRVCSSYEGRMEGQSQREERGKGKEGRVRRSGDGRAGVQSNGDRRETYALRAMLEGL
jgi:hypothetical protein